MLRLGITGEAGVGKSTVWRALTGGKSKSEIGIASIPDAWLDKLADAHSSPQVPVAFEVADVHQRRTAGEAIAALREADVILNVVGVFAGEDASVALPQLRDTEILSDMIPITSRLERARKDRNAKSEVVVLEKASGVLEDGRPLREEVWEANEIVYLQHMAPLSLKPTVICLNVGEQQISRAGESIGISICAELEAEAAELEHNEATALLAEYGIERRGTQKLVDEVFRVSDLVTFYTCSEKESRAWVVRRGATAPVAAGAVHSDMERGFIRAEVCEVQELLQAGTWDQAKAAGRLRVEGKDYVVGDGDVLRILFSV